VTTNEDESSKAFRIKRALARAKELRAKYPEEHDYRVELARYFATTARDDRERREWEEMFKMMKTLRRHEVD
jgi:hypothetical protein